MSRLAVALVAVLVAACSTLPTETAVSPDPAAAWQDRRSSLASLSRWTATGRVAINAEDRSWNATLHWVQREDAYRIRLIAPLGQGTVQISGDGDGVVLRTSDNRRYAAGDPETLMFDTLGWSVPVAGLRYWMRGLDDPGTPSAVRLDSRGRLDNLAQYGWDIQYQRYADVPPLELPTKLALASDRVDVRMVINRWELDTP